MRRQIWKHIFLLFMLLGVFTAGATVTVQAKEDYQLTGTDSLTLRYGQRLGEASLENISVLKADRTRAEGTLSWEAPDKLMQMVGTGMETLIFTPKGIESEKPAEGVTEEETTTEEAATEGTETSADEGTEDAAKEAANEAEADSPTEAGKQMEQIRFSVFVTVEKGQLRVEKWPELTSRSAQDGDILQDAVSIKGGSVVCDLNTLPKKTKESVLGHFCWEEPRLRLESGKQEAILLFVPEQTDRYEQFSCPIEVQASPRKVKLSLQVSENTIMTGQEVTLTALVEKDDRIENLEGSITFLANGEMILSDAELTKTEKGWTVQTGWSAQDADTYVLQAFYLPADNHTAKAKSSGSKVTVAAPLSGILTEELPEGEEGQKYKAALETDASGLFPVRFSVASGELPEGMVLDNESGVLSGIPKAGSYSFVIEAAEGGLTVQKEFTLCIKEKKKLPLSLECPDVVYGDKPLAALKTTEEVQLVYRCYYEGVEDTKYEKTEEPPLLPGRYRVHTVVEKPVDFAGQEMFCDFTIKKAKPVLSVQADPEKLVGKGKCNLSIQVSNPVDEKLRKNLPVPSVAFQPGVKITAALEGVDDSYRMTFQVDNEDATIRCSVSTGENSCYEAAEAYVDVNVKKEAPPEQKPQEEVKPAPKPVPPQPAVKTAEEIEDDFWQDVIFRIYRAQDKGETVTINAKGHGSMPDKVMAALRQHEKVTLALVWEGDMILIPAGKAQAYDKKFENWTLGELSNRYPLPKAPEAPKPPPQPQPPVVSKPSKPSVAPPADIGKDKAPVQTEEETAETTETESVTSQTESVMEKPEASDEAETEAMAEPVLSNEKQIDWFLVAVCVLAGIGVVMVVIAFITLEKVKREEDE